MVFALQRRMTMQQHQRRDIQDWLNLFEQQKQSGLTAVEFCRQQQINVQTVSDLKSALYAVFGTFQGNNASNFSTVVASAILSSTYLM